MAAPEPTPSSDHAAGSPQSALETSAAPQTTHSGDSPTSGPLRARFLDALPPHPELQRVAEAFERGNYALVRREAPRLIESAEDDAVRDAARDLLRRIEPDPLMKYLLALAIALLVGVTVFAYATQGHG
jgi:hypothetical protein